MHRPPHTRRAFLADTGMGLTGLALGGLLFKDGITSKASAADLSNAIAAPGTTHHVPKAKTVIWIFLIGGVSHMESFDPKPVLSKYDGKSIDDTPLAALADEDRVNSNLLRSTAKHREIYKKIKGLQTGFKPYGQNGTLVSDWFPNIGGVIDDIALVRSMWTLDNNHGAQLTFHTGRKINEGAQPTVGSWASYGLGSLNNNLPEFVVLGEPSADCCGRSYTYGPAYLGAEHGGVRLKVDPKNPLAYVNPGAGISKEELRENFSLLGQLNQLAGVDYPEDDELKARIKSYELAFQMQSAVPELMQFDQEPDHVRKLYGLDQSLTKTFGSQLLAARRMAERGVRFIQVFHGYNGGAGRWDSHKDIKKNHARLASEVDLPTAGLIKDLKQRGLLDDTLVVWGTEFGRTPGAEIRDKNKSVGTGRDHHPHGFTCWLAGGGIKGGTVHGATDELGFHAIEDRHYVTDLHATVLHQLGLDPRKLQYPGRKRLEMDYGEVIRDIIA